MKIAIPNQVVIGFVGTAKTACEDRIGAGSRLSLFSTQHPCLSTISQSPRVPMVQPSDTGNGDDLPHFARFDCAIQGSVLPKPEMCLVLVVLVNIGPDHAPKLPLIDCDHMVQAVHS